MQFTESWLREFCTPPLSTQALADLLTMSGMEVEELRPVAPPFSGVVVAEILSAEPHPQADRLRVCLVDAGGESVIASLTEVGPALAGKAGTRIVPDKPARRQTGTPQARDGETAAGPRRKQPAPRKRTAGSAQVIDIHSKRRAASR